MAANLINIIAWLIICQLIVLVLPMTQAKIPAVIVFGDSSVDAGNNNEIPTMARSDFLPYGRDFPGGRPTGRFCNGRLPSDFISEGLGLKPLIPAYLDPTCNISDFATGVSFASAATGYDNDTSDVLSVIPLWKEVEYYKEYQERLKYFLGTNKAIEQLKEALYLISIGTNDFLEDYYTFPEKQAQFTIDQYEDYLANIAENFLKQLYNLGARKISLGGICPMGCLPLERATNENDDCNEEYNVVAQHFNAKLDKLVIKLNNELPGIKLVFSNPYNILLQIIHTPNRFGFEVVDRGCCGTGEFEMGYVCNNDNIFTCPDATKYVFWDAFHPTQKTNHLLAYYLLNHSLAQFHE